MAVVGSIAPVPRGKYHPPGEEEIWFKNMVFVTGGARPMTGHYGTLNVSPTIVNCAGGRAAEGSCAGNHHGGDRCTVRLGRGRGIGFVCNVLRGRFRSCCRGTTGTRNRANIMLLAVVRAHLSGMTFEANFYGAHHRTERTISRNRFAMGNGEMGVPSCLIGTNSMVTITRADGSGTEFGTIGRRNIFNISPG